MKIKLTSVLVDDQDKALKFYTGILIFAEHSTQASGHSGSEQEGRSNRLALKG